MRRSCCGIDFLGPLAFIGLSQVRESATFSGIPLVERLRERTYGVWVVHIESGETLGFLRFEAGVQEIFAVQVLAGLRFPEILEWDNERLAHSYVLPDEALAQVKLPSAEELARSPAFPNARYNLGVALGDAEDYAGAIACLQAAAEAEPGWAEIWNSLGYLACRERRPREAVAYYERAIERQPDYAQAHFNLGMTLLQLGDYRRGLAARVALEDWTVHAV
jgi:tetratricopeptide (TPR) repeat protein